MKPLRIDYQSFDILAEASRIGLSATLNLTPKRHLDFIKFESLLYDQSHIPLKFDTMITLQGYYPDSLTYTNIGNYVQVASNCAEFNVRYIESVLHDIEIVEDYDSKILFNQDKYNSEILDTELELGPVFFTPGSNLNMAVNISKLDEYMNLYDDMLIKPHPLFEDQDIHDLSLRYGYDRIIEKEISAEDVIQACSKVYYCDNSEIGLRAMLLNKPTEHMNNLENASSTTYFHLYHLLRKSPDETKAVLAYNFLSNHLFGYFNIDMSEDVLSTQIEEYLHKVEDLRQHLKPRIRGYDLKSISKQNNCNCKD